MINYYNIDDTVVIGMLMLGYAIAGLGSGTTFISAMATSIKSISRYPGWLNLTTFNELPD